MLHIFSVFGCISNIMLFHTNTLVTPFSANDNSLTIYEVLYRGVDTPNAVNDIFFEAVLHVTEMTMSFDILGLMAYSTYNVSVRATNQYGVGEFSEEVTVRTEEGG